MSRGEHVGDELVALLDGALDARRAEAATRHLEACASCRVERDRLARALAVVAALAPPPAPSPGFSARLEARLAAEREREWRSPFAWLRRPAWRLAVPAAALAGALALVAVASRREEARAVAVAADLDLYEDYEVVTSLGDVASAEDARVVAQLDELMQEEP